MNILKIYHIYMYMVLTQKIDSIFFLANIKHLFYVIFIQTNKLFWRKYGVIINIKKNQNYTLSLFTSSATDEF